MPLGAARFGLLGGVADLGKLELIETQTASADSSLDFISLGSYNVHFLTANLTEATSEVEIQISNNGGTSYYTTGYQYAEQYGSVGGTFAESKSTNRAHIFTYGGSSSGLSKNGYTYFYNLGDSSKYSFATSHFFGEHPTLINYFKFAMGSYPTAEIHNAIRLYTTGTFTGTVSLYGIAES
jgi:hypothetical protein